MPGIEIVQMRAEHARAAAQAFAEQRQRQHLAEPLLPHSDVDERMAHVLCAMLDESDTAGWIALDGEQARAYIIGHDYLLDDDDMRRTFLPPRFCWMRYHGIVAARPADARFLPLLWGHLAAWFLHRGGIIHLVEHLHADPVLDEIWRDLGFGRTNCSAVRDLDLPLDLPAEPYMEAGPRLRKPAELHIRPARLDDIGTLLDFHFANIDYHKSAPIFEYADPAMANREEMTMRDELVTNISDMRSTVLLAERESDGQILGAATAQARPPLVPERYLLLHHGSAYIRDVLVRPDARGQGVGTALFLALRAALLQHGFTISYLNFIPANPVSSRFWPRMGFRPLTYRLQRTIDSRYLRSHAAAF